MSDGMTVSDHYEDSDEFETLSPVVGYGLRHKNKSYWIGIWNDRAVAEHMRSRYRGGDKDMEIVPVQEAQ